MKENNKTMNECQTQNMICKGNHVLENCKYDKKVLKNLIVVDSEKEIFLFEDCKTCKHCYDGIAWDKEKYVGKERIIKLCIFVRK